MYSRQPTMVNSLQTLLKFGVPVNTVLDVGVNKKTEPLIKTFPDIKHHLFEPIDIYFDDIRKNYQDIDYELHNTALSDTDGNTYLAGISIDNSKQITHSYITDNPLTNDEEPRLIVCKKIAKVRLDSIIDSLDIDYPCLLKVDVDGHELPILKGAEQILYNASVIIIEAPLNNESMSPFFERSLYLLDKGFCLFDIIDLTYYYGVLSQVDLIFIRKDILKNSVNLMPKDTKIFKWSAWFPLTDKFFDLRKRLLYSFLETFNKFFPLD